LSRTEPAELEPAATVTLLRDGPAGLDVLMLRRTSKLTFAGNWVFPGGRVDPADAEGLEPDDVLGAARRAAVRETAEETGIAIEPGSLVWFSHWTPPEAAPRRFSTHFFAAPVPDPDVAVAIDPTEADDWTWMEPAHALAERDRGNIELSPPTWITLHHLSRFETVEHALTSMRDGEVEYFATRVCADGPHLVLLYDGDAGYESTAWSWPPTAGTTSATPD
jgi:8-oxo-dGTP pyrophosphatase MutT (NUDIX family)